MNRREVIVGAAAIAASAVLPVPTALLSVMRLSAVH
jgi:hypothetical protein